ncbi:MAG: ABC transporter substrate-binding protein [Marinospirillum sp.]|uniref:MlaC/ttg2D family ABC transporter substrate-binding protein n=1 Tax=Marinospirillum sp. TaxID=2183934 RepID=UPI001A08FF1C|nr:ABC transporter substrate-binding protein [Marinospirillum sp.]MBE0505341.1 ABC transporter substrate-binding protein [Marinospirillum sp.]
MKWSGIFAVVLILLLSVQTQAGQVQSSATSWQVVEAGLADLTVAFERSKPNYEQDPQQLYTALDQALLPYVDFRYISARVMGGRYFRAATPEQRSRFAEVFQVTLVRTFGQGLMNFDYREFDLRIIERPARFEDQDNVELEVVANDGQRYPLVFTLRRHNDEWKIINLIVNGVNLGLTFNSQFDRAMREHNRNFDRVIDGWSPEQALEEMQAQEDKT